MYLYIYLLDASSLNCSPARVVRGIMYVVWSKFVGPQITRVDNLCNLANTGTIQEKTYPIILHAKLLGSIFQTMNFNTKQVQTKFIYLHIYVSACIYIYIYRCIFTNIYSYIYKYLCITSRICICSIYFQLDVFENNILAQSVFKALNCARGHFLYQCGKFLSIE